MQPYKREFLALAAEYGVLKFGRFTLKSGRESPYFFNLGAIASGASLRRLARCYAALLEEQGVVCDMLFGPAYKGIPLVSAIATVLAEAGTDLPFAYNRKEAKDHGEGGLTVGAPLGGRVAVVDDIITAGTALREALGLIRAAGGEPVAALLAFDRMEKGRGELSAVAELQQEQGIEVACIANLDDLADWLAEGPDEERHRQIVEYRSRYGAAG